MTLALVAVRLGSILAVQIAWLRVVGPVWVLVSAALAAALAPVAAPGAALFDASHGLGAYGTEAALGLVVGSLAALPGWALIGAAERSGGELGLPEHHLLTALALGFVTATVLELQLHHGVIAALIATLESFPVGQPLTWLPLVGSPAAIVEAAQNLLFLALSLATPVLLVAAGLELFTSLFAGRRWGDAVGDLGRWLRLAMALAALAASWATHPQAWVRAAGA